MDWFKDLDAAYDFARELANETGLVSYISEVYDGDFGDECIEVEPKGKRRIKWYHEGKWYYGIAEYRDDMIVFSSDMQNQAFDSVDVDDLEDGFYGLDSIWGEILTLAECEEDGIPDVTEFHLS